MRARTVYGIDNEKVYGVYSLQQVTVSEHG